MIFIASSVWPQFQLRKANIFLHRWLVFRLHTELLVTDAVKCWWIEWKPFNLYTSTQNMRTTQSDNVVESVQQQHFMSIFVSSRLITIRREHRKYHNCVMVVMIIRSAYDIRLRQCRNCRISNGNFVIAEWFSRRKHQTESGENNKWYVCGVQTELHHTYQWQQKFYQQQSNNLYSVLIRRTYMLGVKWIQLRLPFDPYRSAYRARNSQP